MRTKMLVLLAAAALAAATAGAARADTVVVGATHCALVNGGHETVPAGSTVTIRMGFAEATRGTLQAFLNAITTTLSVDGGQATDVTGLFGPPEQRADGSWASFAFAPTGVTLAAGQSLTFVEQVVLAHSVPEVVPGSGKPAVNPAGAQQALACTVTAV